MRRFFLILAVGLALNLVNSVYLMAEDTICNVAKKALTEASIIRGLSIKKPVPCVVENKKEIENYIRTIIADQLPPDKLKYEEIVYKKLGILPEDYDYKQGMIELYVSQLGGYYDPDKDRYVMAGWLPALMQKGVAAHELTHALQDQYYDLKKLIDPKTQNGDVVLAHSALVEGDATAVMYDFDQKKLNKIQLKDRENIDDILLASLSSIASSPGSIPKSMQMMLIFPYTSGLSFVFQVLKKDGYAGLNAVYGRPPATTEEVIHAEKYFNNSKDYTEFDEKDFSHEINQSYTKVYSDVIGEFGVIALLNMFDNSQSEIRKAAAGWGGDLLALFFNQEENKYKLIWKINWDSENDMLEFLHIYNGIFTSKYKEAESKIETNKNLVSISIEF